MMVLWRVGKLPATASAAAAVFYAEMMPDLRDHADGALTLVFPPANPAHRAWRLAAIQALASDFAPRRVNAVVSDDEAAIAAAAGYLEGAEAITGQLLGLDGASSPDVVS